MAMITGRWTPPGGDISDALLVRRRVFVDEQGFSPESEPDALDALSWQAVLYEEGRPIATGRIYWQDGEFHIGRICVLKERRGQQCGDLLMRLLLYKALDHAARSVVLGAQVQAMPFYAKYGFAPFGEIYDDEGVPHQAMRVLAEKMRLEGGCQKSAACEGKHCAGCAERQS